MNVFIFHTHVRIESYGLEWFGLCPCPALVSRLDHFAIGSFHLANMELTPHASSNHMWSVSISVLERILVYDFALLGGSCRDMS